MSQDTRRPVGGGGGTNSRQVEETEGRDRDPGIQQAAGIIEAFLRREGTPERISDAWKRVKQAAFRPQSGGISVVLEEIKRDISQLKSTVLSTNKQTYAQAASRSLTGGPPATSRIATIPTRQEKEVVVSTGEESPTQKQRNGQELVEDLNAKFPGNPVLAARRLPSGDVLITTESKEKRQELQKDQSWTASLGAGAVVKRRGYTVLAHGIRVSQIDTNSQNEAIQEILKQNRGLKDKVEILRVGWTRRAIKGEKQVAPLLVTVAEPEQADYLIDNGLLWGYQLHDCELFHGDCNIVQCFRCYKYGHIAKTCGNSARCGFCSSLSHKTNECLWKEDTNRHRCAACDKPEARHFAWHKNCPTKIERVYRARQAYAQRPIRFKDNRDQKAPTTQAIAPIRTPLELPLEDQIREVFGTPEGDPMETTPTINIQKYAGTKRPHESSNTAQDKVWQVAMAKRKPGRPPTAVALSVAARGQRDIQGLMTPQSNTQ